MSELPSNPLLVLLEAAFKSPLQEHRAGRKRAAPSPEHSLKQPQMHKHAFSHVQSSAKTAENHVSSSEEFNETVDIDIDSGNDNYKNYSVGEPFESSFISHSLFPANMEFDFDSFVKIAVVGDQGTGKTNLIKTLTQGTQAFSELPGEYRLTTDTEIIEASVATNKGCIKLNFMVTVGQEVWHQADGVILMFDLVSKGTYRDLCAAASAMEMHFLENDEEILRYGMDMDPRRGKPVVVLGNKCDLPEEEHKFKPSHITLPRELQIPYFTISARTGVAFEGGCRVGRTRQEVSASVATDFRKPLLYILKHVTGFDDLEFVDAE